VAGFSNYLEAELLDHVFGVASYTMPTAYLSFHTGDPGETGASEASGMARQSLNAKMDAASGGAITSNTLVSVTSSHGSDQTISYLGVWDAVSGGNFLASLLMSTGKTIGNGDTLSFAAGDLDFTLD
jgi:hypothetical protein